MAVSQRIKLTVVFVLPLVLLSTMLPAASPPAPSSLGATEVSQETPISLAYLPLVMRDHGPPTPTATPTRTSTPWPSPTPTPTSTRRPP